MITSDTRDAWQKLADDLGPARPSKGKRVRVTQGKHKGKEGIVTWHDRDKFDSTSRYETTAQAWLRDMAGTYGYRCRIDTDTETFFVGAEKVEVIHEGEQS